MHHKLDMNDVDPGRMRETMENALQSLRARLASAPDEQSARPIRARIKRISRILSDAG